MPGLCICSNYSTVCLVYVSALTALQERILCQDSDYFRHSVDSLQSSTVNAGRIAALVGSGFIKKNPKDPDPGWDLGFKIFDSKKSSELRPVKLNFKATKNSVEPFL